MPSTTRTDAHPSGTRLRSYVVALVLLCGLAPGLAATGPAAGAAVAGSAVPLTAKGIGTPASWARLFPSVPRSKADFRVASFNILGHDHTAKGSKAKQYANGRVRMSMAVELIKRSKIGVVGFQEFQQEQRARFMRLTGRGWDHYPGNELNFTEMHNSIAWRTNRWTLVEKHTIRIPYFQGRMQRMPYLLLKHRATGTRVWFANFHNPADSRGNAERWRDEATRRQVRLAARLARTGHPVIVTGDMNEREEYFCAMTQGAPMVAAQGGSSGPGRCVPPTWPTRRPGIDWIFGSTDLRFSNYVRRVDDGTALITDHPVLVVDVDLPRRRRTR